MTQRGELHVPSRQLQSVVERDPLSQLAGRLLQEVEGDVAGHALNVVAELGDQTLQTTLLVQRHRLGRGEGNTEGKERQG